MVDRAGVNIVEPGLNLDTNVLPGRGVHSAFGHRTGLNVDAEEDVWCGPTIRRPLPLVAQAMEIVSDSASDAYLVGGAFFSVVTFIDENGDWRSSDLLPMNGLTPVAITYKVDDGIFGDASRQPATPSPPDGGSALASIFRVQDAYVVVAVGATELVPFVSNIGLISVQGAGAGTVFEVIPIMKGRSRSAAFHVPRNCTGLLTYAPAATERGRAEMSLGVTFGLGTAWQDVPVAAVNDSNVLFKSDPSATRVSARADVQGRVKSGTNNVDVFWILQFRLERNS